MLLLNFQAPEFPLLYFLQAPLYMLFYSLPSVTGFVVEVFPGYIIC